MYPHASGHRSKEILASRPIDAWIVVPEPVESNEEFRIAYLCDRKGYLFGVVENGHSHVDVVSYLSHGIQASICIVDGQRNLEFLCGNIMLSNQVDVDAGSSAPAVDKARHRKLFYHVFGLEYDRDSQLVAFTSSDVSLLSTELFYGLLQLFFVQSLQVIYKLIIYLLMMLVVHPLM